MGRPSSLLQPNLSWLEPPQCLCLKLEHECSLNADIAYQDDPQLPVFPQGLLKASLLCMSAGTIDTWLLWNLTGGTQGGIFVTDATNAARTNLMDIHKMQWDDQMLHRFGVQRSMLPDIKSNAEVYGKVRSGGLAGKIRLSAQHTLEESAPTDAATALYSRQRLPVHFACKQLRDLGAGGVAVGAAGLQSVPLSLPGMLQASPLLAASGTRWLPCWGSAAEQGRPRTPMARAASSCSTRGSGQWTAAMGSSRL